MKVERLTLRNFRNVRDCTFHPDSQLNFLVGANGQGKTSFLEALSFLATLRSFRGAKSDEVILWGEKHSEIACTLTTDDEPGASAWKTDLKVTFDFSDASQTNGKRPRATKSAWINGKAYRSSTQYLSQRFGNFELGFHTIVFNPSDHDLIRGEPAGRRSYLDRLLAAEDLEYLECVQRYGRLLEQKNALLRAPVAPQADLLMGFTEPMAALAARITLKRLTWLSRLRERLSARAEEIAPRQLPLRAIYVSNWVPQIDNLSIYNNKLNDVHFAGHCDLPSLETLEQAFWTQMSNLREAEIRSGSTLVGPHRDDWLFFHGDHVLKGHGSQGEVRSALLALKLSEVELFRERTGHRPLFLLDDFSSELDQERRTFLLRFLMKGDLQVFVTTTEATIFEGKKFFVSQGNLGKKEFDDHSTIHSERE